MKNIIIFGSGQNAELAKFYFENDPSYQDDYNVVAFTVHQSHLNNRNSYLGKPLVPYEKLSYLYPVNSHLLFAPLSGKNLSQIREQVYNEGKKMGYEFVSYISSYSTVLSRDIGENCFILEDNTIQPFTKIGNNCILWSGNHIGHGSIIDDSVFITSHVVVSGNCVIKKYSWIGVNSCLRDGLKLKEGTLLGMGAVLTKNTEAYTMYIGVPAKPIGPSNTEKIMNSL